MLASTACGHGEPMIPHALRPPGRQVLLQSQPSPGWGCLTLSCGCRPVPNLPHTPPQRLAGSPSDWQRPGSHSRARGHTSRSMSLQAGQLGAEVWRERHASARTERRRRPRAVPLHRAALIATERLLAALPWSKFLQGLGPLGCVTLLGWRSCSLSLHGTTMYVSHESLPRPSLHRCCCALTEGWKVAGGVATPECVRTYIAAQACWRQRWDRGPLLLLG